MNVEENINTSLRKTNSMRVNDGMKKDTILSECQTKSEICFMTKSQNNNEHNKTRRSDTGVNKKCSMEKSNTCDHGDEFFNGVSFKDHIVDANHGDYEANTKVNNVDTRNQANGLNNLDGVLNNNCQLKLEQSSVSLDSDVKAFKRSIQELLEKFFTSVKDFEAYKKRYNEIVQKHQEDSLVEMEQYVNELLYHIISEAELSALTEKSRKGTLMSIESRQSDESISDKNYLLDDISAQYDTNDSSMLHEEVSNIWRTSSLFTTDGFDNLNLLCQSKVRDMDVVTVMNVVTSKGSANIKTEKAISLHNIKQNTSAMLKDSLEIDSADISIPIKTSNAQKDIRIDNKQDNQGPSVNTKNFLEKICSYICRKFRRDNVI